MSIDTETKTKPPVEDAVCLAAARVLGLERVDPGSNFFELGGSSLSVALLTEQLEATLGLQCPMQLLYENPVLADFAEALRGDQPWGGDA